MARVILLGPSLVWMMVMTCISLLVGFGTPGLYAIAGTVKPIVLDNLGTPMPAGGGHIIRAVWLVQVSVYAAVNEKTGG